MRPLDVLSVEGGNVILFCGANGRDRNGVQPKIVWLRNGSTLDFMLVILYMNIPSILYTNIPGILYMNIPSILYMNIPSPATRWHDEAYG